VFGLLKAREEREELMNEEDRWLSGDVGTEWVVRSVDAIWDVARGDEGEGSGKEKAKL
jgi:hypothetical protein